MPLLRFKPPGVEPGEFLGEAFEFDSSLDTSLEFFQLSLRDIEHVGASCLGPGEVMALVVTSF